MTPRQFIAFALQGSWVEGENGELNEFPVSHYHLMLQMKDWHSRGSIDRVLNDKGLSALLHKMEREGLVKKARWFVERRGNCWVWTV